MEKLIVILIGVGGVIATVFNGDIRTWILYNFHQLSSLKFTLLQEVKGNEIFHQSRC